MQPSFAIRRAPAAAMLAACLALTLETAWADEGPRLTFATKRFGGVQLMSAGIDGSNPEQITTEAEDATQPMWSPDGSKLAYVIGPPLQGKIKIRDVDGGNPHLLLDDGGPQKSPQWSPDGKRLLFSMRDAENNNFNLFAVNFDGTDLKNLTNARRFSACPAWSPDGEKIAFSSDGPGGRRGLWLMNADGTQQGDFIHRDLYGMVYPSWSPDGKQIAYCSAEDREHSQLRQINADGTGDAPLTDGAKPYSYPSWSPDGRYLAYVSRPLSEDGDLCLYDVLTSEHRVILESVVFVGIHQDGRPAWVPIKK